MSRASASPTVVSLPARLTAFAEELDYVYRMFRRLGAQPAEAEDLAQDVFVVMCRRWGDFRPDRPLRPWLAGIAHHVAMDHFRKHSRREVATASIDQEDRAPGPEAQLASARARDLALRALATLPEHHRSILIKHELDGVPIREIADESSLPFFTAAARIRRARLRFARAVKQLQQRERGRPALLPVAAVLDAERAGPQVRAGSAAQRRPRLHGGPALVPAAVAALMAGALLVVGVVLPGAASSGISDVAMPAVAREGRQGIDRRPGPPLALASRTSRGGQLAPPRLLPPVGDPPASSASPPEMLARGLVGHWRFEDGPGSLMARDSSGQGRPCLLHELDVDRAWVPGARGGALDLGSSGWLECPLPEARAGVPFELSAAAWIQPVRRMVGQRKRDSVLFTRQLGSADPRHHLFWFGLRNENLAVWSWAWMGWNAWPLPAVAPPASTGAADPASPAWTHVAFVHARRETRLYVNGAVVSHQRGHLPRGDEALVHSALTIGGTRYLPDPLRVRQHFDGLVDEAMIYDRALSTAEVALLARRAE